MIERRFGRIPVSDFDEPGWVARREEAARQYPEMVWAHSHVVDTPQDLITYCFYAAPHEKYVRDHATAAGVPCDVVNECVTIEPDEQYLRDHAAPAASVPAASAE